MAQTQNFARRFLNLLYPMEIIRQILIILNFSTIPVDFFSKIFKTFHPIYNFPRFKPSLSFFDKFLNEIIEFIGNFSEVIGSLHKNGNIEVFKIFFKNSEIFVKYAQFFEMFLRKMDFSGKKNVDIFEK